MVGRRRAGLTLCYECLRKERGGVGGVLPERPQAEMVGDKRRQGHESEMKW